jgi:hypothetical protein
MILQGFHRRRADLSCGTSDENVHWVGEADALDPFEEVPL